MATPSTLKAIGQLEKVIVSQSKTVVDKYKAFKAAETEDNVLAAASEHKQRTANELGEAVARLGALHDQETFISLSHRPIHTTAYFGKDFLPPSQPPSYCIRLGFFLFVPSATRKLYRLPVLSWSDLLGFPQT